MQEPSAGTIVRVAGPIVDASGLRAAHVYEVVEVGHLRLIGEVIRTDGDKVTVQVYESTTGVKPFDPLYPTGAPLSVCLGPGLIGNIYDGIQRPLREIVTKSGAFIQRGEKALPLDLQKRWHFVPSVSTGQSILPGAILGTVQETELLEHRILVPPDVGGKVTRIVDEGDYTLQDVIAEVDDEDETHPLRMFHKWPVREPRPSRRRREVHAPLVTGQRVIDTLFPIGRGGTAAIPGGFGTGKTVTQHALAKWSDADIIVYIGCGERGNEMTGVLQDFPRLTDPRTGRSLMERTVLIANTSNMPVAAREVSIYTGITIAEYYRDMGYDVAVMADSTSRWAEALRELSGRLEELPAEEGFPAYLPTRLAQFYERAGVVETLSEKEGTVTIIGAVSPPGGDFAEPVTQHTRRFIRCFWALDTVLANARHYPSINWLTSYSEYLDEIREWWEQIDPEWADLRSQAVDILQREDKLQQIVKLVGPDVLPDNQRLVLVAAQLLRDGFLAQNAFDDVDMYCEPHKQVATLRLILEVYRRGLHVIERGGSWTSVAELECVQELVRAKSTIPGTDREALAALASRVRTELDNLERQQS